MDVLLVIAAALMGSLFSLVGGLYLIVGGQKTAFIKRVAVPFAAGALLAAAFMDLLPEALNEGDHKDTLMWALAGILLFFVLERGLRWFHHHHAHADERDVNKSLIIIGDLIHNFIDGLALGAAFLVSPATGIIATIAIAAHEIPQEIGDFALLLSKGMRRRNVLIVNVLSAVITVVAAAAVFMIGSEIDLPLSGILALTAGFFIYIAVSDIIPSIHAVKDGRSANIQTLILLAGVFIVTATTTYLHQFIDDHDHNATHSEHEENHDHEHDHDH